MVAWLEGASRVLMRIVRASAFSVSLLSLSASAWSQPVSVSHHDGLVSIRCHEASLSSIFESIQRETGIALTLEDPVKSKRVTADLTDVPVAQAVSRLLEGAGVNYIVMMDPLDWHRVGKIFIGGGGGAAAQSGATRRPGPVTPEPGFEEPAPPEPADAV